LVPPPAQDEERPAPPKAEPSAKGAMPAVDIRLLSIQRGVIEYRDDSKKRPVEIDVVPIEVSVRNFSSKGGSESAYAFTAEFGEKEVLSWEGTFQVDPLESDGHVSLSHVGLNTFWPSLRDRFRFDILSGKLSVDARYHFDTRLSPVNLQMTEGKVQLADFRLSEAGSREPVLTVPSFGIDGISLDLSKRELGIGTAALTGADIRAWLAEDGVINFKPLFAPVHQPQEAAEQVAQAGIRSDVWAKLGLELLDIKRTVFTLVDYPVHMDGIIKAVFDSVYLISGKNSTLLYVDRADLSRVHVDNMEQGFNLVRVDYFVVRNSTFTHCIDGINAVGSSNVFAYQSSFNNNYRGIYMLGNGTSGMTELGCCNFYNNEYCIQGQDILLSISPLANNSGLGIVGKNKFTLANNSQLYFDVQYYYRLIDQIEGSYNYWGGSAPQAGNYALTRGGNDIPLIYTPYYTNPLTIVCNTAGGSGGNDMCPILDQVSGLSLPVIRALAMDDFHNSNTEDAETKMQWISNYQNQYYEYGTPYCRFQFDYARVFTKVDPPIIGQGQPIVTETGKHNLTKGLRLAPNPAKDLITIETESELERIEVFNSAGSLVSAQLCDGHIAKINCKEWPEGPYLIRAKCSNESIFSSQIISKE